MKLKVLVLGGTYFVGWYIVKRLIEENYDVIILNRGTRKGIHGAKVTEIYGDRKDAIQISELLSCTKVDYVIDVSGYDLEDVRISYDALKTHKLKQYIFISSSAVYRPSDFMPISENFPKGENHFWGDYGTDKLNAEEFLFAKFRENGFPVISLRPPYIYGEGNNVYREGFIFDRITAGKKIVIPGDGRTLVQFIHIEDLYKTITALMHSDECIGEAYNVGDTAGVTFTGWVEKCIKTYDQQADTINFFYQKTAYACRDFFPFHDYQYVLDTRKIERFYKPKMSMDNGLARALNWYKENEHLVEKRDHYAINGDKILREFDR